MAKKSLTVGKLFLIATLSALLVRLFLLEDYRIASNSMAPNLIAGDLVFISKGAFNIRLPFSTYEVIKFRRPTHGNVVAFTLPDHGLDTFVKRVVGVEGDRIQIKEGVLLLNGNPVDEPYRLNKNEKMKDFGPIDVPKEHFFALGDNRLESIDSRNWGPVPYSCLKGRVAFIWMSISESGVPQLGRIGSKFN